ncbi:hypothetical protein X907_0654 [Glycocaulis alkaliphilus]|uniref:Uncharacterized protein n=1 Tax=Glycocaulis alkaliphilus TaxID=1434191 RepID=A0A3T0E7B1_9PROT|nr:hypothetical protein [Glycocaulis alkaliphilus]AZU03199.1 hypothetical protein X907_0654 [Glycocaulis alkaliphilus]GGB71720.1 hypothetical protein GCM10007417_09450 [Glycocaulis alkaliphilus]
MTQQPAFNSDAAIQALRAVLAAIIAAAFIGLVVLLAAVLTAAAFVVAGLAVLGAGAYWVYRKVRGRRKTDSSVLVARRGPHGWTVDGTSAPRS